MWSVKSSLTQRLMKCKMTQMNTKFTFSIPTLRLLFFIIIASFFPNCMQFSIDFLHINVHINVFIHSLLRTMHIHSEIFSEHFDKTSVYSRNNNVCRLKCNLFIMHNSKIQAKRKIQVTYPKAAGRKEKKSRQTKDNWMFLTK